MIESALLFVAPFLAAPQQSTGFAEMADRVSEQTLSNGLRVLVMPHGEAPVASFHLYVKVGAVDEEAGLTGLAHFAEHMAFKGSARIGAVDWEAEKQALAAADDAWQAYESVVTQGAGGNADALFAAFEARREAADNLLDSGAFDRYMEEAGGLDQNAGTGADSTNYYVSLPVTQLEKYFWLTREQIGSPAMREFYRERDVVMEERRMRTDSSPFGALLETVVNAAFVAHPYRDSTIGHMDDLKFVDRPSMIDFWNRHYTADRMVLGVVGRVEPAEVFALAEKYLSDLPAGTEPRPRRTVEPLQKGERVIHVTRPTAPAALLAWKVPAQVGRERWVHEALADVLGGGDYSRLHTKLVKQEGAAVDVSSFAGFPGSMDPCLFVVIVRPAPGSSLGNCVQLIQAEIDRLAAGGVSNEELVGVRQRAKMALLESIESNSGLASQLCAYEAEEGDWRMLFGSLEALEDVTSEALAESAARLVQMQRTTGYLMPPGMSIDGEEGK